MIGRVREGWRGLPRLVGLRAVEEHGRQPASDMRDVI
jgi:hypothetical protein